MSRITRKELAEVIGEQTMHIKNKQELVSGIAAYLAAERRSVDLGSLTRDVMQYRLEHGIVEAVVVCAFPLDARVMQDIRQLLKEHFPDAKHFVVDQRVDKTVVGGIRIELPRENLDLTVRLKLNMFKRLVAEEGVR